MRGAIAGIVGAEQRNPHAGIGRANLEIHHRSGISVVFLGRIESQASHCKLQVEALLDCEGDLLGTADEQQVVGHAPEIDRSGGRAVPGEELDLRLTRPVAVGPGELAEQPVVPRRRLLAAVCEQGSEGLADRRIGVASEDHTPAGAREVVRIDAEAGRLDGQCDGRKRTAATRGRNESLV